MKSLQTIKDQIKDTRAYYKKIQTQAMKSKIIDEVPDDGTTGEISTLSYLDDEDSLPKFNFGSLQEELRKREIPNIHSKNPFLKHRIPKKKDFCRACTPSAPRNQRKARRKVDKGGKGRGINEKKRKNVMDFLNANELFSYDEDAGALPPGQIMFVKGKRDGNLMKNCNFFEIEKKRNLS